LLPAHEERIAGRFDLLSVPSARLRERFAGRPKVALQHHGLDKALFDQPHPNPYAASRPNVLYVGRHRFDADFLRRALRLFPKWSFHVIGQIGALPAAANLTCHGERPFAELVPYLQHADIGLQNLEYAPGAEVFTDSLKMFQYTYCRLPIVAPRFLKNDRRHVYYYEPGDDVSIGAALRSAHDHDRHTISTAGVLSWDDLAAKLAGDGFQARQLRVSA
jgi:2-beta-glucuronyltransferase